MPPYGYANQKMGTASRVRWVESTSFWKAKQCRSTINYSSFSLPNNYPFLLFTLRSRSRSRSRSNPTIVSLLNSPSSSVSEVVEDDVLQEFLQDRQLKGDLITKYSDILFKRRGMSFTDEKTRESVSSQATEETLADEPEGGFLKLTKTHEWLLGETSAPTNRKPTNKEIQDTRERRRQLSLLSYEALKSELVFLTLAVGAACTGYCLLIFSAQAAVSYASGVGFSYLYLRLLYQYVDKLSQDSIPLIFRQRKPKKIGIRSGDLQDSFEKSVKGVGLALSSPRLVIPATIYGLWILLHRNFASDIFDFQIVPAMMGLFAYKAAALIQVYRDNEKLELEFPDDI